MESQQTTLQGKIILFPLLIYSFGYQKPRGFLKSKYMISTGTQFLQDSWDTRCNFGPPRGLFVLIMTAVSHIGCFCYSFRVQVHCSSKGLLAHTRLVYMSILAIFVPSRAIRGSRHTTTTSLGRVLNGGIVFLSTITLQSWSPRKLVICQFWMRHGGLCP